MKIFVIPDLHGKSIWEEVKEKLDQYDKIVFLGDYVDDFTCSDTDILDNLCEIIDFKKLHPKKVELLLGNHDIQYLFFPEFRCSGFRSSMKSSLFNVFQQNKQLFKVAYQINNTLFSHAGISNFWYIQHYEFLEEFEKAFEFETLAETLNHILLTSKYAVLAEVGYKRGGSAYAGGPFWADISETKQSLLPGFHQVVGHSKIPDILRVGNEKESVTYCDVLDTKTEFYELSL